MLRRVALVRSDVPEECTTSIIRVIRIGELETLAVTNNQSTLSILVTLIIEAIRYSETSVLTRAKRNIPEDGILHSHRRENLKPYKALTGWAL
jgi:hypothetical protein